MFGIRMEIGSDMMPGAWLALDNAGAILGSGILGMGEQWNGDKKMVTTFKVSPEVYGEMVRRAVISSTS